MDLNMITYRNVSIGPRSDANLEQFCEDNKHSVEILKLSLIFLEPAARLLAIFNNITHLTLDTYPPEIGASFDVKDFHPIELPNLKFLNSFSPLLKVIYKHQVKELIVNARIFDEYCVLKVEAESVRKFLMNCPDLVALTVIGQVDFFSATYNFKLKTLHFSNNQFTQFYPRYVYDKFRLFLLSQKESLKELTLDCDRLVEKNFILSDMGLSLYHDLSYSLFFDLQQEMEMVPSTTIKDLKIQGKAAERSFKYFQIHIKNCPMVEKLDLLQFHGDSYNILPHLALLSHLKKLKLRIPFLSTHELIPMARFENLKHLQVIIELQQNTLNANSTHLLESIINCSPFLKFLHLIHDMRFKRYYYEVPIDLERLLTPLENVEELHLEGFILENYQFVFKTNIRKVKVFTQHPANHAHLPGIFNSTPVRLFLIKA